VAGQRYVDNGKIITTGGLTTASMLKRPLAVRYIV
jgi:hypothetical protein